MNMAVEIEGNFIGILSFGTKLGNALLGNNIHRVSGLFTAREIGELAA